MFNQPTELVSIATDQGPRDDRCQNDEHRTETDGADTIHHLAVGRKEVLQSQCEVGRQQDDEGLKPSVFEFQSVSRQHKEAEHDRDCNQEALQQQRRLADFIAGRINSLSGPVLHVAMNAGKERGQRDRTTAQRRNRQRGKAGADILKPVILNEGRQKLYGNVGYGVIEANIK